MAPKAKPAAAKSDAKPKGGAKKKAAAEKPEEEKPRMEAPDFTAYEAERKVIFDEIDKLQKEERGLQEQISGRSAGKEEFFAEKAVIRAELDELSQKMNVIQEKKEQISKMLGDKNAEKQEMKAELGKMKKNMGYTSEAQIDDRIAHIEMKMQTESLTIKQEKDFMAEIKELRKTKPSISKVSQMESRLQGFEGGANLHEERKILNEQFQVLREQKKAVQEKLSALADKRKEQMGDMGEIYEKRTALQEKIKVKRDEASKLRDAFTEKKREYDIYRQEQRRKQQEKYEEDKKQRQQEWEIKSMEKEVEKLDEQPFVHEVTLIEQTIKFCESLLPQKSTDGKEEKKETVFNNKDGETVLISKENREEEFWMAPAKGKAAKAAKKKGGGEAAKKTIRHNAETFKLFSSLGLDAPITTADIPPLMEKLNAEKDKYDAKVKEWEETREEMKRKIKEGIITKEELLAATGGNEEKEEEKEDDDFQLPTENSIKGVEGQGWQIATKVAPSLIPDSGNGRFAQADLESEKEVIVKNGVFMKDIDSVKGLPKDTMIVFTNEDELEKYVKLVVAEGYTKEKAHEIFEHFVHGFDKKHALLNVSAYTVNHSDALDKGLNVEINTESKDGKIRWVGKATQNIKKGDELMIDYRRFSIPEFYKDYAKKNSFPDVRTAVITAVYGEDSEYLKD